MKLVLVVVAVCLVAVIAGVFAGRRLEGMKDSSSPKNPKPNWLTQAWTAVGFGRGGEKKIPPPRAVQSGYDKYGVTGGTLSFSRIGWPAALRNVDGDVYWATTRTGRMIFKPAAPENAMSKTIAPWEFVEPETLPSIADFAESTDRVVKRRGVWEPVYKVKAYARNRSRDESLEKTLYVDQHGQEIDYFATEGKSTV